MKGVTMLRPFSDWTDESLTFLQRAMAFFEMASGEFSREWKGLSAQDKIDLKTGIQNGSLTY